MDMVVIDEILMEYYTITRNMIESYLFMVNVRVAARVHSDRFCRVRNPTNKLKLMHCTVFEGLSLLCHVENK